MESNNKRWSNLSPTKKRFVVGALIGHVCLVGVAHADLSKRPAEQVHGPKWLWRLLTAANTSFTLTYLLWGRHKHTVGHAPAGSS